MELWELLAVVLILAFYIIWVLGILLMCLVILISTTKGSFEND